MICFCLRVVVVRSVLLRFSRFKILILITIISLVTTRAAAAFTCLCRPSWTSARRHSSKQVHRQSRQRQRQHLRHQHQVVAQNKATSRARSAGARLARPSAQQRVTFSHHRRGLTSERRTASFQSTPPSLWQESMPTTRRIFINVLLAEKKHQ